MNDRRSFTIIIIGFTLVVLGVVLPALMVFKILPSTFFLNFFSYGAQISGLFLGVIGSAMYIGQRRRKDRDNKVG